MMYGMISTDETFVVDYKSTVGKRNQESTGLAEITLPEYIKAYKRQMDMYQWILDRKVSMLVLVIWFM